MVIVVLTLAKASINIPCKERDSYTGNLMPKNYGIYKDGQNCCEDGEQVEMKKCCCKEAKGYDAVAGRVACCEGKAVSCVYGDDINPNTGEPLTENAKKVLNDCIQRH